MQINAITRTNKDVWREEGRDKEGKGERRGEKGRKPSLGSFCCSPCAASPGPLEQPVQLVISAIPSLSLLVSSALYSLPSDDATSVVLL